MLVEEQGMITASQFEIKRLLTSCGLYTVVFTKSWMFSNNDGTVCVRFHDVSKIANHGTESESDIDDIQTRNCG